MCLSAMAKPAVQVRSFLTRMPAQNDHIVMLQKCTGERPGGFVAVEYQEWFRLRALPAMKRIARENFLEYGGPEWFSYSTYSSLCGAVGHVHSGMNPFFMVSQDCDPRHSMKHFWKAIDAGKRMTSNTIDRRDIAAGLEGHIPIDKVRNYVPTAPKVPDSLQFAIESVFAPVKRRYQSLLHGRDQISPGDMVWAIDRAFAEVATPATIKNCFDHCEGNVRIFCGKEDESVMLGGVKYHCTHGNWLPKDRRG